METDPSTYTLNTWQFEQALAILQREQQAHAPSARQEKIFKVLNRAISGFVIAYLVAVPLTIYVAFGSDYDGQTPFKTFLFVLIGIIGITFIILAAGITVLFFLSLSYFRRLLRQRKLARQLGLWEAMHTPWKTKRRQHRLRNVLDSGILIFGWLMTGAGLSAIPMVAIDMRGNQPLFTKQFLVSGLICFVIGVAIIVTLSVRRSKERLGLIARLYSSLEGYKDEVKQDSNIHIPAEAYEKIAQIERAQIARDRVQSILDGRDKASTSPYVLQKSHAAQQAQARLDATTRVHVQDQIDALMMEPYPVGITREPKAGAFHLRVPETAVIISFTVDDQAHRIQILSVASTSHSTESSSAPGK